MTDTVDRRLSPESVRALEQAQAELSDVLSAVTKVGLMPWNHGAAIVQHHADLLTSVATAIGKTKLTLAASRDLDVHPDR
jgi:hypothetical protein